MRYGSLIAAGLLTLLAMAVGASGQTTAAAEHNSLAGVVVDDASGDPLPGASVTILNTYGGCQTDGEGRFELKNLRTGLYKIRFSFVGYHSVTLDSLEIPSTEPIDLTIRLVEKPTSIRGITVTPGVYSITGNAPAEKQTLSKEVLTARPQISEDLFRSAQRLPGIVNTDFSAQFVVRGGEQDEVMINLDGLQLYEPFHLKDVDGGALSIVDVAAIEGVDLLAGGYPSEFGDRMSGVFNIRSINPTVEYTELSLGLSATHARALAKGSFSKGRGSWVISARRGFLDLVLDATGEEDQLRPSFYDLFGKVNYSLSGDHLLSGGILAAHDNLDYEGAASDDNDNHGDTLYSSYGNAYAWMTMYSTFGSRLTGRSIVSAGRVSRKREGQMFDAPHGVVEMAVDDYRRFWLAGLKSDWEYELRSNLLLKAGMEVRQFDMKYDYLGQAFEYEVFDYGAGPVYQLDRIDTVQADLKPDGNQLHAYFATRCRLLPFATAEVGVRYDKTSYTDDKDYSPRANLAIDFSPSTSLKLGWGHFYQTQRIDEISVEDGEHEFGSAERADHFVVGFRHADSQGKEMRVNGFYKKYRDLRPAFRNTFGELVSFPELEEDRARVTFEGKRAYGLEFYFIENDGGRFDYWLSYAISKVEDDVKSLYFYQEDVLVNYDRWMPFLYDQLHTMYLDLIYRVAENWQVNIAWQYHTGWPVTDVTIATEVNGEPTTPYLEAGDPWADQLDPYNRIDLRLTRKFTTSRGVLTAYVEVINLLDHKNVRNYEYSMATVPGGYSLVKDSEDWFGIMPSFGLIYDFHM